MSVKNTCPTWSRQNQCNACDVFVQGTQTRKSQPLLFNCRSYLPVVYPASTNEALKTESWRHNGSTKLQRTCRNKEACLVVTDGSPFTILIGNLFGEPTATRRKFKSMQRDFCAKLSDQITQIHSKTN